MVGVIVGKKKSAPGPDPKVEPKRVRAAATIIRSHQNWKEAVERMAEFDRCPSVADLFDRAVAHYARAIGFPEAIPKR